MLPTVVMATVRETSALIWPDQPNHSPPRLAIKPSSATARPPADADTGARHLHPVGHHDNPVHPTSSMATGRADSDVLQRAAGRALSLSAAAVPNTSFIGNPTK